MFFEETTEDEEGKLTKVVDARKLLSEMGLASKMDSATDSPSAATAPPASLSPSGAPAPEGFAPVSRKGIPQTGEHETFKPARRRNAVERKGKASGEPT